MSVSMVVLVSLPFTCSTRSSKARPSALGSACSARYRGNELVLGVRNQYFPKSTNLSVYGPMMLREVEERLNNRPRKNLDWRTPAQVFAEGLAP
nr:hypothetical protein GCM10017611_52290 [Rhodococcus wratislaviensis]